MNSLKSNTIYDIRFGRTTEYHHLQSEDGAVRLDVRLADNTVWLTQQQMADLYRSSRTNVVEHIKHIYEEGELQENATCRKFRQVRQEGNREVAREIPYYNLDMIISLGYRQTCWPQAQLQPCYWQKCKRYK